MATNTSTVQSLTTTSPVTSRLSLAGTTLFVVLLTALHLIKPELDPSWHFISEYAIGDFGWIMVIAFFALALSYVMLSIALRPYLRTVVGRIGLILLLVSAAGLTLAGVFTTDPIMASPDELTTQGSLHNIGGTLGIAMPFAVLSVSLGLVHNQAWASARRLLFLTTALVLFAFLFAFFSLGVMLSQNGGSFGPDVLVGWPNRIEMLAYCVWLLVVAGNASRVTRSSP
jgi:hypothetical protein